MRISTEWVTRICAVCDRTLLQGEHVRKLRRAPNGEPVDVCALCERTALAHGWVREGTPLLPLPGPERRRPRQKLPSLAAFFGNARLRRHESEADAGESIVSRLSDVEAAIVDAVDAFNASDFRRTAAGLRRSLGEARVSIVPLPGLRGEVVVTIAWDLSWYQYRINPDGVQAVRLAQRGYELDEIDEGLRGWNGTLSEDGRIVSEISRV